MDTHRLKRLMSALLTNLHTAENSENPPATGAFAAVRETLATSASIILPAWLPACFIAALLSLILLGAVARGEGVQLLPTEIPLGEPYEALLASHPEINAEPLSPVEALPPVEPLPFVEALPSIGSPDEPEVELPPGARNGVLQNVSFQGSWISKGGGPQAMGLSTLELSTVLGFPFPKRTTPLVIKPGFSVSYLDGPQMPDLPPRVYDAFLQFRRLRQLSDRWGIDLSVTPGVYSDFEQSTSEAFRMSGHFGAMFNCTPRFDIILGVAYLPYQDLRILPFAGILWRPTDDWKIEITVPRPMIARRITQRRPLLGHGFLRRLCRGGLCGDGLGDTCSDIAAVEVSDWVYIAGELGGGSWAIRRANDTNDVVTYRDLRLILGYERENPKYLSYHAEIAYVFCRKFEYDSNTPCIHPGDSIMLRLGTTY